MVTWPVVLISITTALAALPAGMVVWNLLLYRGVLPTEQTSENQDDTGLSVLIPARDEESSIREALESVLAAAGAGDLPVEVVVLDDASTDATAAIVQDITRSDSRVRLIEGTPLPPDWCGKQWACWQLAQAAKYETLMWIDADVRLEPDALPSVVATLNQSTADLISGFPRQVTKSWAERLVVPQVLLVLLGYLPIWGMRRSVMPGFGAGCGQLFVARREAYFLVGGHASPGVRASLHDGVTLPRAFRLAGRSTDLFDATSIARCRMYHGWDQVWRGFRKNASEGLATPVGIWVWTVLLLGGHVFPWVLLAVWAAHKMLERFGPLGMAELSDSSRLGPMVVLSAALSGLSSVLLAWRFRQGVGAAVVRPMGVIVLLVIQWGAVWDRWRGHESSWRGRSYPAKG